LKECFEKNGDEISSVIIEGIQGVGGIRVASDSFLQLIRNLCNQYGAVFIADSVQDGYGRTGKFYAHDYAGIDADIYTMAKGMGNGFPIGAISISPEIAPKHFMLGTTFGGNHLACAAAIAVLEVIEQESLIKNAEEVGNYLMAEIGKIVELKNLRGKGLMIGFDVPEELKDLKKNLLHKHKIFTGEAKPNVIRLLPSLALTIADADIFLNALKKEIAFLMEKSKASVSY
jgi:acetylornithine/N-succinyldiaminopimelate aminotransferase